jgi:hypothetical protein
LPSILMDGTHASSLQVTNHLEVKTNMCYEVKDSKIKIKNQVKVKDEMQG